MSDKLIKYIIAIPVILLALLPPKYFEIPMLVNDFWWLWLVLISGFLGIFFIFTKADIILKILSVYLFLNCFTSKAPYLSFTAYFSVILCLYFYLLCLKLKDWDFIYKVVLSIFILNGVFIVNQFLGRDTLLNFGQTATVRFGTIGNLMQLKSFMIVLLAFIVACRRFNFIKKYFRQAFVLMVILSIFYVIKHNAIHWFLYARGPVWIETIKLSFNHPFIGYGIGTYKVMFPPLSNYVCSLEGLWATAHNAILQLIFEIGYLGFTLVAVITGKIIYTAFKKCDVHLIFGIFLLLATLSVHFPDRRINSILIIVLFLALCQREVKDGVKI